MSRSSGFEFTYSLESFLKTIRFRNYWGISDPDLFEKEQEKNVIAAIEDVKYLPHQSVSNEELIDKIDSLARKVKEAKDVLSNETGNDYVECLSKNLVKLSDAFERLHRKAQTLPLWCFTYYQQEVSNYKHPLNYFRVLLDKNCIGDELAHFYQHAEANGFDVDTIYQKCSDQGIEIKFSDVLQKQVNEEMFFSLSLITSYARQEPAKTEEYIKSIYLTLQTLLVKAKDQQLRNYPFVEKTLSDIKKWIEKEYSVYISALKTKKLPGDMALEKLNLSINGKKANDAVKYFHEALTQKYIDSKTTLPQLRQVLNGGDFSERIVWLGGSESLYHLITTLKKHGVLGFSSKNQWKAVANSFVKVNHQEFDHIALGKNRSPSDTTELDKICQILINAKTKGK